MIGLIREWLEFWVKRNWLKHIDRPIDKHNRLDRETKAQAYVVHELLKRYNEASGGAAPAAHHHPEKREDGQLAVPLRLRADAPPLSA